jgi:hypothetical protein
VNGSSTYASIGHQSLGLDPELSKDSSASISRVAVISNTAIVSPATQVKINYELDQVLKSKIFKDISLYREKIPSALVKDGFIFYKIAFYK